jgi:hypothetical protein
MPQDIAQIFYIGEDMNFFINLHDDLKKLQKDDNQVVELERRAVPSGHYPVLFKELWSRKPAAVLLDFAGYAAKNDSRMQFLMGVMKLLRQNFATKPILTLAIHDYLQSPVLVELLLLAGVRFNYIKSAENDLVAHEIQTILNIKGLEAKPLAQALDNTECQVIQDLRVSYATSEFLRVETNVSLTVGKVLHLSKHPFSNPENSNILSVKVAPSTEGALYFPYKYSYQLHYHDRETDRAEKKDITFLGETPIPRQTRVLIVDSQLEFIDEKLPDLDELNFSLNIQSDFQSVPKVMERFKPHIVAVQNLEPEQIAKIKTLLHPKASLLKFKSQEKAPLCTSAPLTFSMVEDLARAYQNKVTVDLSGKFFFSSSHPGCVAKVAHAITIKALSEGQVYFESKIEFPEFCVLEMLQPFKTLITTIPTRSKLENLKKCQVGIFNYTSESEIQKIRQRINSIFTKESQLKREKDKEVLAQANANFLEKQNQKAAAKKEEP